MFLVVYTPNYAIEPYEIVWHTKMKNGIDDGIDAAQSWREKPAEDSSVRLYRVPDSTNLKAWLRWLNRTMEIYIP